MPPKTGLPGYNHLKILDIERLKPYIPPLPTKPYAPPPTPMIDLATALRTTVESYYKSMVDRPAMFGDVDQIEAIWITILDFEAVLLDPGMPVERMSKARHDAHMEVANSQGWPSPLPLCAQAKEHSTLMPLLQALRAAFLRNLKP